jgi:hypothetical protein
LRHQHYQLTHNHRVILFTNCSTDSKTPRDFGWTRGMERGSRGSHYSTHSTSHDTKRKQLDAQVSALQSAERVPGAISFVQERHKAAQVTTQSTYMDEGSNIMQQRFQHILVELQVTVAKATLSKVENTAIRVGYLLLVKISIFHSCRNFASCPRQSRDARRRKCSRRIT